MEVDKSLRDQHFICTSKHIHKTSKNFNKCNVKLGINNEQLVITYISNKSKQLTLNIQLQF